MRGTDGPKPGLPAAQEEYWKCFHCGEMFTEKADAQDHFGADQIDDPACIIKQNERGLVGEIRSLEKQLLEARTENVQLKYLAPQAAAAGGVAPTSTLTSVLEERDRYKAALDKYGGHRPSGCRYFGGYDCDCGWSELERALRSGDTQ